MIVSVGIIVLMLMSACASLAKGTDSTNNVVSDNNSVTDSNPSETTSAPTVAPTHIPPSTELATVTLSPTEGPTPTSYPPVFDPYALGDNLELASFIVTAKVKNTSSGGLSETTNTVRYIKEPLSVYSLIKASYDGGGGEDKSYLIDGWFYTENPSGDLYLYIEANQPGQSNTENLQRRADMREGNMISVLSAQFVGQEDFQGIPANHFTFDQSDLENFEYFTEANPAPGVEGDFYLAQDGNYVLFSHFKETRTVGGYEVTEELTSIDQLTEIVLPAGFVPSNLELELSVPFPADTILMGIIRYENGIGVDYYTYDSSVSSQDEFLEFYKNLASTDGWKVSYIGKIINHDTCDSQDCVIIQKGDAQIILFYRKGYGTLGADWDKQHVFRP